MNGKTVYISDEGHVLDESDFVQYVLFKIEEAKKNKTNWTNLLEQEWWGDSLLDKEVLNKILVINKYYDKRTSEFH